MQNLQNAGGTIASVNGRENHKWHAGSNPALTTKNFNKTLTLVISSFLRFVLYLYIKLIIKTYTT